MAGWGWLDYCLLGVIGVSGLVGLMRGFVREAFSLCLWAGAGWLALHYSHDLAPLLPESIKAVRPALAFLAIYAAALLAGGIAGFMLGKLVSASGLGGPDRLAGLLFGMARGGLIVVMLMMLPSIAPSSKHLPGWKDSKLIKQFQPLADRLRGQGPAGLSALNQIPQAILKLR
ncbi:MAG: CvpA family protein [Candidatus Methylumidiphilus sp.]